MHAEARDWIAAALSAHGGPPISSVLEVGSQDINGSVRGLFVGCRYVGLDVVDRPGVDWVGLAHDYAAKGWDGEPFDALVSTECLEHDPYWDRTLASTIALVRVGGLVAFTCASYARPVHGLFDTPEAGYYRNLGASELRPVLDAAGVEGRFKVARAGEDIYFAGRRVR
jgi:hypothetical protein